jgi:hypothetical protein
MQHRLAVVVPQVTAYDAQGSLRPRFPRRRAQAEQKLDYLCFSGAGNPAPLPLGESGASSVKGGSERRAACLDALDRDGAEPGTISAAT